MPLDAAEIDVAVIGAGVNGTYISWKLNSANKQNNQQLNVHIFEASQRIGGRLYTIFFPEMPHIPVELGGMRFKDIHERVTKLANTLELTVVPFISGDTNNIYYLRGVRLRKNDLTDPSKLPYKLAENEQGKSASEIIEDAISVLIPNFKTMSQEEWQSNRSTITYKDKLLKDISWINFLSSRLSSEAFQFLADIGDISLISDSSVLSQLNSRKSPTSKKILSIAEGYQAIPLKLAEKFQQSGGNVHLNHRLVQISRAADRKVGYELTFVNESGGEFKYSANKVILTISPTALLELLPKTPLAKDTALQKNLNGVAPNVLTKIFLAYRTPWWRILNLKEGNSVTAMPIRSCYYFASEEDFLKNAHNTNALLLASYQGSFTPFWRSLNASKPFSNPAQNGFSTDIIPGDHLVIQAQHQLKLLHGLTDIPEPYAAAFQDWGQAPYYAAFYFWKVGSDPHQIDREVRKPLNTEEIYIFTSDYCEDQGWVECSLELSDRLLAEYFGLKE